MANIKLKVTLSTLVLYDIIITLIARQPLQSCISFHFFFLYLF